MSIILFEAIQQNSRRSRRLMRGMDHESGQARSSLLLSFEKFTKFMLYKVKAKRQNVGRQQRATEKNDNICFLKRKLISLQKI
ncbi:hypothetical protein BXU10_05265 [Flavobacterium sp. LM4]|nr:hypothetical protein BXU10_05265 [Flavobacterium sp. LM4]